jgi:uncharacterized membrane protein YgcG
LNKSLQIINQVTNQAINQALNQSIMSGFPMYGPFGVGGRVVEGFPIPMVGHPYVKVVDYRRDRTRPPTLTTFTGGGRLSHILSPHYGDPMANCSVCNILHAVVNIDAFGRCSSCCRRSGRSPCGGHISNSSSTRRVETPCSGCGYSIYILPEDLHKSTLCGSCESKSSTTGGGSSTTGGGSSTTGGGSSTTGGGSSTTGGGSSTTGTHKYCSSCGEPNKLTAKFCTKCCDKF